MFRERSINDGINLSESRSLPCPRCGMTFQAKLYLIIDTAECPIEAEQWVEKISRAFQNALQ